MTKLNWLRLPVSVLGVLGFFVSQRYFGGEAYTGGLSLGFISLLIISIAIAVLKAMESKKNGFTSEAKVFGLVVLWKVGVLLGLCSYLLYGLSLGDNPSPETNVSKMLLAAWVSMPFFGGFLGIGVELSLLRSGFPIS